MQHGPCCMGQNHLAAEPIRNAKTSGKHCYVQVMKCQFEMKGPSLIFMDDLSNPGPLFRIRFRIAHLIAFEDHSRYGCGLSQGAAVSQSKRVPDEQGKSNFIKILTTIGGPGWHLSMCPKRFRLGFFNSLDIVFIYRKLGFSLAQLNDSEVIAIISGTNGKLFKMTASRIDRIKTYQFSVLLSSVYVRIM